MLEEAERQVAELEAALRGPAERRKVAHLPGLVEVCLLDLKGIVAVKRSLILNVY